MNKTVIMFDIDGVIYDGHTIFDVIQDQEKTGFIESGLWNLVFEDLKAYKAGNMTYEEAANSMLRNYAHFLKGKKYEEILNYNYDFFSKKKDKFFDYFPKLVREIEEKSQIYFITTNFQFTTEAICKIFDIKKYISSEVGVESGILTGKVDKTLAGNKSVALEILNEKKYNRSIALGDSENDMEMLKLVSHPVAFEPDEKLKSFAENNNWLITDRHNAYQKILNLI